MLPLALLLGLLAFAHSHSSLDRLSIASARSFREVAALNALQATLPSLPVQLDASFTLSASLLPTARSASGLVPVTVAWSSPSPAERDAIALHCTGDPLTVGDYFNLTGASGSFPVPLVHGTGCRFEFRYIQGGLGTAAARVTAITPAPALGADSDPVGTRLSYGDAAGDVLLTFASLTNSSTAPGYVSVGLAPGGPYAQHFGTAPPTTYHPQDLCHAPANTSSITSYIFPGYFHTATLRLSPGTRYYAIYGHAGSPPAPETTFVTRSLPTPGQPTRFAAFADSALYPVFPGTVTTIDNINALDSDEGPIDFVTVTGDLGYSEGSTVLWAMWAAFLYPVSSRIPTLVAVGVSAVPSLPHSSQRPTQRPAHCPSLTPPPLPPSRPTHPTQNHETNVNVCYSRNPIAQQSLWQGPTAANPYGDDSGGEGGIPTLVRYQGPSNGQGIHYYSVEAGNVHFVHFSSEHDYTAGSPQRAFLERDLRSVDRSATPWLVVGMHRPMYNSRDDGDWSINMGMRAALEELFVEAKVDLVLSGCVLAAAGDGACRRPPLSLTGTTPPLPPLLGTTTTTSAPPLCAT